MWLYYSCLTGTTFGQILVCVWPKCGAMFLIGVILVHIWFLSFLSKFAQENVDQKWCVFGEFLVMCAPNLVHILYPYNMQC